MKVTMIGWYGSETLGDRGILIGIIELLYQRYGHCHYTISSFNTCFTNRCMQEDLELIQRIDCNFSYNVVNSHKKDVTKKSILESDVVVIGGGPLMSMGSMYMLDYYVAYAAKKGIPVLNMGTGIGDLKSGYNKLAMNIIANCTMSVFRDENSLEITQSALGKSDLRSYTFDPAILPCRLFKSYTKKKDTTNDKSVCRVNFRSFPSKSFNSSTVNNITEFQHNFLRLIADKFDEVELIPMHNFFYGDDDRYILSEIRQALGISNIEVHHYPQSVHDLYKSYFDAECVVGMRYHSVVFQTLLNGNNIIVDYTPRGRGKITGFLKSISDFSTEFKSNRYFNLFDEECDLSVVKDDFFDIENGIQVNEEVYEKTTEEYNFIFDKFSL